jgi:SAM-dependent methyltransferase
VTEPELTVSELIARGRDREAAIRGSRPEATPNPRGTAMKTQDLTTVSDLPIPDPTSPNRALWEKGDFTRIASTMRESGDEFVATLGIAEGMTVLDLGCGDGTTAVPAAQRGAEVLGVDIAENLVAAGRRRAQELGLTNLRFTQGDARNLAGLAEGGFDLVVSVFGAMFAPDPLDVAAEMVRVTRAGGRIVMGNWIPGDPTLVAQILRISAAYAPPPAGVPSPMQWGQPDEVRARFVAAGIPESAVACEPNTFTFRFPGTPAQLVDEFRDWYGPTMNAFAAAAGAGREADLHAELVELFEQCDESTDSACTVIPATFLRVTVDR